MLETAPSVGAAATEWLSYIAAAKSAETYRSYRSAVSWLVQDLGRAGPMADVTVAGVNRWVGRVHRQRSASTAHNYALIGRLFLRYCYRAGWTERDLAAFVDPPRAAQVIRWPLPEAAVMRLYAACEDDRDKAMILLLYGTGVRVSELVGLTWSDIDLDARTVLVRGKGSKQRLLGLSPTVAAAVARLRGEKGRFLLGLSRTSSVRYRLGILADRAGIGHATPHQLRHSFAHAVLRPDGSNLLQLRDMLGHERLETTLRYLRDRQRQAATRALQDQSPAERLRGA